MRQYRWGNLDVLRWVSSHECQSREEIHNRKGRERKAKTMVSVLQDYFKTDLKSLNLLDVGYAPVTYGC